MAKKKAKKVTKKAKVKKIKKVKKTIVRKSAKGGSASGGKVVKKLKVAAAPKEKVLGKIDHYFDKISVAAIKVKGAFKVGDVIHIKGHTTDFVEKIASMQINHQDVAKVKPGDDVGLKVREQVREHDVVYLAGKESLARLSPLPVAQQQPAVKPQPVFNEPRPLAGQKPKALYQTSIFNAEKTLTRPVVKPVPPPLASPPQPPAAPKPAPEKKKNDPYSGTKFFNF